MAHNTRIRADVGAWSTGAVTPAEFNSLDQGQFVGINGDDGGTYAPAAAIIIGGSGLRVTGDLRIPSGGTITGDSGSVISVDAVSINDLNATIGPGNALSVANGAAVSVSGELSVNSGGYFILNAASIVSLGPPSNLAHTSLNVHTIITDRAPLHLSGWTAASATSSPPRGWAQSAEGTGLIFGVRAVPKLGTLTAVYVAVIGASGHGGQPENMPQIRLESFDEGGGLRTLIGTANDAWTSVGAYEAAHYISLTGLTLNLTTELQYPIQLRIIGESGANYVAGLRVVYAYCIHTVARLGAQ